MDINSTWKIPVQNWTKIDEKSALFIFNESTKLLTHTIEIGDKITNRSYNFLLLVISMLTAVIGFSINKLLDNSLMVKYIICNSVFLIAMSIVCYILIKLISPRILHHSGRIPIEICSKEFLIENYSYLSVILNEIENNQHKIDSNLFANSKRLKRLNNSISSLLTITVIYAVVMITLALL